MATTGTGDLSSPISLLKYPISKYPLPEFIVLTLATLTRFWRLNYHSIWFDESVSLHWAGVDLHTMWAITFQLVEEKHPPVYYTGLHLWQTLMDFFGLGQNDAALRTFGALLGVLTVWGIMLLVARTSGRTTALLAGLLVALSPVLIWYSQELRMFQLATTLIVWSAYFLVRAWQEEVIGRRLIWWIGLISVLDAALYAYLFSAFILPTMGLMLLTLLLFSIQQERAAYPFQRFVEGVAALVMASLIFLPLALNAWSVNANESTPGQAFENFIQNSYKLFKIFTLWREEWPQGLTDSGLIVLALLFLFGLFLPFTPLSSQPPATRSQCPDRFWLVIWIGIPLLVANLLLSRSGSIFDEDRYLIFMVPFVLWAIARGAVALGQRWSPAGWFSGFLAVSLLAGTLPRMWTPAMYRENWRAANDYIVSYQQASPALSSAVVPHVNYTHRPLDWYLKPHYSHTELPVFQLFGTPLTSDQIDNVIAPPLLGIRKELGTATLWLTQSHLAGIDDARVVEQWLNQTYPVITEQYPAGVKLTGYALQSQFDSLPELMAQASYPNIELAPGLTLAACEILTPQLRARDEQMGHPPSNWVHVRLWWQATGEIQDNYMATAQMIGPEGVWGDRLPLSDPSRDALHHFPSKDWTNSLYIRNELNVNLNPVTPVGRYPLWIGVQDSSGQVMETKAHCGDVDIIG